MYHSLCHAIPGKAHTSCIDEHGQSCTRWAGERAQNKHSDARSKHSYWFCVVFPYFYSYCCSYSYLFSYCYSYSYLYSCLYSSLCSLFRHPSKILNAKSTSRTHILNRRWEFNYIGQSPTAIIFYICYSNYFFFEATHAGTSRVEGRIWFAWVFLILFVFLHKFTKI